MREQATGAAPAQSGFDLDRSFVALSFAVPVVGLALFFAYPLWCIFIRSLTQPDGAYGFVNYAEILLSPGFWRATRHSLEMGTSVTALSIVLGFVIAHGLHRCHFRGKTLVRAGIALPLLAPSLVQGLGLIFILGRSGLVNKLFGLEIEIYGFWGLLLANTLYALPQAVLIIGASLTLSDARIYEAAEVMGTPPWRQFIDITLARARYGLLSATFVVFTVTITDFGNAAVIGGDYSVLATEIYNQVVGQMNFNLGAVVGILLLLPTVLSFYIERLAGQWQANGQSGNAVPLVPVFTKLRDVPMAALSYAVALASAAVIAVVVYAGFVKLWPYSFALTLKHYDITLAGGYSPLWTSVWVSLLAASGGTLMLFLLGNAIKGVPPAVAKIISFIAILPAAVPGMVMGLAYVIAFNVPDTPLYLFYGTATMLAISNFYHYHAQGFLTAMTGINQVPAALEEAACCLGASRPRIVLDVILPYVTPMLVSVFFFLFMRSMVTLSAVIFLTTPQVSLAAVTIMRLDEAGLTSQAAAYSTCVMAVVSAALIGMKAALRHMSRHNREAA